MVKSAMSNLMKATVAMKEFRPDVIFNSKRKDIHDNYFIGPTSYYYNDIMNHLNLNATLVKADRVGTCYASGNCTGLYSLIQTGKADFSLPPMQYTFAPDVPVSSLNPVVHGPFVMERSISMLSFPISNRTEIQLNILQTYKDTSFFVYLLLICFTLIFHLLFNIRPLKGKRKQKQVSLFSLYSVLINNGSIDPSKFITSVITVAILSIFTFFSLTIVKASVSCDFLKIIPEKYYESLEMVVKDVQADKTRALCIKNLNAHSAISGRDEKVFKKLLESMEFIAIWDQPKVPYLMMKDKPTLFFASEVISLNVQTHFCGKGKGMEYYIQLRRSKPFLNYHTSMGMKVNIDPQLRKRVHDVYNSIFEKGITNEFMKSISIHNARRVGIEKSKIFNCRSTYDIIRYNEKQVSVPQQLDLLATGIVFKLLLFMSFVTFIFLYIEFYLSNRKSHKNVT